MFLLSLFVIKYKNFVRLSDHQLTETKVKAPDTKLSCLERASYFVLPLVVTEADAVICHSREVLPVSAFHPGEPFECFGRGSEPDRGPNNGKR